MPPKRKRMVVEPDVRAVAGSSERFPPLREDLSAPKGTFLNIKTTASEGGRSYMSRSGFTKLATSRQFVERLRRDIRGLFADVWDGYSKHLAKQKVNGNGRSRQIDAVEQSMFGMFLHHFRLQGWHQAQFFWSEHEETRRAMYQSVIRICTEPLGTVADTLSQAAERTSTPPGVPTEHVVFQACMSLFAMYAFQSTSVLTTTELHSSDQEKAARIALEADVFEALCKLPSLMKHFPQNDVDEVTFVVRTMLGTDSDRSESVFDVVAPRHYRARSPLIDNEYLSKGELMRKCKPAGKLISEITKQTDRLSKSDLGLAMVRQALDMPMTLRRQSRSDPVKSDSSSHDARVRLEKGQVRFTWKSVGSGMVAPYTRHLETHEEALEAMHEAHEMVKQKRRTALGTIGIIDCPFVEKMQRAVSTVAQKGLTDEDEAPIDDVEELVKRPRLHLHDIVRHSRARMLDQLLKGLRGTDKASAP